MRLFPAYTALCLAASAGLFFGTANPLIHIPFAILAYPLSLCLAARFPSPFRLGWLCGIPGAALSLYWIACAAWHYGGFPWALAVPCSVLLGMYVALWGGLFSWALARFSVLGAGSRAIAAGSLWFVLEWGRGWFCSGFPWMTLSSGLAAWPLLLQPLCVLGEYGYSAMLAASAFLCGEGIWRASASWRANLDGLRFLFAGMALCLSFVLFGILRINVCADQPGAGPSIVLSLIQGNVSQDVKWTSQYQKATLEKYILLSEACVQKARRDAQGISTDIPSGVRKIAAVHPVPDMLVWPETAMPFYYPASPHVAAIRSFSKLMGIPVLTGIPALAKQPDGKNMLLNRACLFFPEGVESFYDKEHLVPFGEFLPPFLDIELFRTLLQGLGGFAKGTHVPLFTLKTRDSISVRLGMLVCYEAIFPEIARQRVADGAQILLNISNDAWYDRTSAPLQHLQLSAMRAVEQNRWLARSTNTGITAFVDPLGRVHALNDASGEYALFSHGHLTGTVVAHNGRTWYFFLHPWLPAAALALLLLCCVRGMALVARERKSKG